MDVMGLDKSLGHIIDNYNAIATQFKSDAIVAVFLLEENNGSYELNLLGVTQN